MEDFWTDTLGDEKCVLDTLPMSDDDHRQIVAHLERALGMPHSERRAHQRVRLDRLRGMMLEIISPDTRDTAFKVKSRNISTGGLAFLHGQVLHPGTECRLTLLTRGKDSVSVEGQVVRCDNVLGNVYEIAVAFNELIELQGMLDPQQLQA